MLRQPDHKSTLPAWLPLLAVVLIPPLLALLAHLIWAAPR